MKMVTASISCWIALCFVGISPVRAHAQKGGMADHDHVVAVPSTSLTLTVDRKVTTLSVAELQAMPQKTVNVHNEHTKTDESYSTVKSAE